MIKNSPASAGDTRDMGLSPVSGRSPEVGNGNPLQYSCLENSVDRGAWRATVHGVTKSLTQLSVCARIHTPTHTHTCLLGSLEGNKSETQYLHLIEGL